MNKKATYKIRVSDEQKTYVITFIVYTCLCLIMALFCWQYYNHLQTTIRKESEMHLKETSQHIANNASRTLMDNFSVLGTIFTVLKNAHVETFSEVEPIVWEQQNYWNYQRILLIDEVGAAYTADGAKVSLTGDTHLRDVIVKQQRSMSSAQIIDNMECIVFAIPIDTLVVDGKEICALAAAYDLTTFDQILSMSAFDGQGYAHIVRRDGTMSIRSSVPAAPVTGYNLISTLSAASFESGNTLENVKKDIQEGKSGQAAFTINNVRTYMAYTPLETQEWCLLTFVPASVANANTNMMISVTLILCGFITLSFAGLIVFLIKSFRHYSQKLARIAYVDSVTGGHTVQHFYETAGALLGSASKPQYALVFGNVEKFKIFNEQFGRRTCDDMLIAIQQGISMDLNPKETMGRIFADHFCVLIEYVQEHEVAERFERWYQNAQQFAEKSGAVWLMPALEFGVYVISNDTLEFPYMIDCAKLALRESSPTLYGKIRFAIYDDIIRKRLFREKLLEDMMDQALEKKEFMVYLQPKYLTQSETIGGAEALVRWQSKSEGMIYPDEFISLFEKNGFIVALDLWVLEEVCCTLRRWLDAGIDLIKISVNCSRVHFQKADFLQNYINICNRIGVPTRYLEIELTENVVFQDFGRLSAIIDSIHEAGFGCSMDDFGSGYSSLNMIQDIPVDTIKLDKIFFRSSSKDMNRLESVVGSIITMSKSLSLEVVAEGVEERAQVDMLKRLGCDYIQGYYFAKPMPISKFEALAFPAFKD